MLQSRWWWEVQHVLALYLARTIMWQILTPWPTVVSRESYFNFQPSSSIYFVTQTSVYRSQHRCVRNCLMRVGPIFTAWDSCVSDSSRYICVLKCASVVMPFLWNLRWAVIRSPGPLLNGGLCLGPPSFCVKQGAPNYVECYDRYTKLSR